MRRFLFCMVVLALGLPSAACGEPVTGTVRFDLYWNYLMVVHGSAGSYKGLNFLIDTGASPSVLDSRAARTLHLKEEPFRVLTEGGVVTTAHADVPSVDFGPMHREHLPMAVADLSFLQKAIPVPIDGILGLDVLGEADFLIDYRSRTIRFGALPALPDSLPLVLQDGLVLVRAQVNGAPAQLVLDTGAGALTMFTGRSPKLRDAVGISEERASLAVVGEVSHGEVRLRSLVLGSHEFGGRTASLVAANPPGPGLDGLLGPAGAGISKVAVSFSGRAVWFAR